MVFVVVWILGNEELKLEELIVYNFGVLFELFRDLLLELDYWNFVFEDLII